MYSGRGCCTELKSCSLTAFVGCHAIMLMHGGTANTKAKQMPEKYE